jgi:hypothetical protein
MRVKNSKGSARGCGRTALLNGEVREESALRALGLCNGALLTFAAARANSAGHDSTRGLQPNPRALALAATHK